MTRLEETIEGLNDISKKGGVSRDEAFAWLLTDIALHVAEIDDILREEKEQKNESGFLSR